MADATGHIGIVQKFLPDTKLLISEHPILEHTKIHQIVGPVSKTSIRGRGVTSPFRDFVLLNAGGERTLVITHEEFEPEFHGINHVEAAHFGAIAGRDEWRDVRHLFILGQPRPGPEAARHHACALTGRPVPSVNPDRTKAGILLASGEGVEITVSRFPTADLEMVGRAIGDAAIVQAVGRARAVNRNVEAPLDVWVASNVVLPWPVNDIRQWRDVCPSSLERMVARGVVLESPADAYAFWRDLFVSVEAAKKDYQRWSLVG